MSTRYQDRMTTALAPYHLPHGIVSTILGSIGRAQSIAARAGGVTGALLDSAARTAFMSGTGLGMLTGAFVALGAALLALAWLPARATAGRDPQRTRAGVPAKT